MKSQNTRAGFMLIGLAIAAMGCEGSTTTEGAGSATPPKPGSSAATAPTGDAKPAAAPKPAEAEMVDHDLSKADPKWAGWTAKGPADAQIMQDGVAGARIAGKGPNALELKPGGDNGFDISFAWGKDDLAGLKKALQTGADASKSTLTFSKDAPDALEYSMQTGETKSFNFVMHMKVEGQDITCKNGNMMGAGNEAQHKRFLDACKTLAKKK